MNKYNKGVSTLTGIIIIIVVAAILFGGVFAYQYFTTKTNSQLQIQSQQQNQNQRQQTINQQTNSNQPINQTKPSITVISPIEGETWQMGTSQTIKFSTSSNMPLAGTCIDAFAVDSNGNKTGLGIGNYIGISERNGGIGFKLGVGDSDSIVPGVYKIELDAHFCAETNNTFITSTTSNGFVTITANPNFIKPTITQISPSQGGENDIITIYGNNLSGVYTILLNGGNAQTNIISKSQNFITFGFTNAIYQLPAGIYQVNVLSSTGKSNSLIFTFKETK